MKKVFTSKTTLQEVDLSKQKPGVYFYVITDDKGNQKTGKIVLDK